MQFNSPTFRRPATVPERQYPAGVICKNQLRVWAISRWRGPTELASFFLSSGYRHLPPGSPRMFELQKYYDGNTGHIIGLFVTFANRPRRSILTHMIKAFDAESEKFNLQEDQPAITVKGVDVEEIFGLKDKSVDGLDIDTILFEDGEFSMNEVPSHFLSKSSGSLRIDGLIADAIKSELADDDFLRRAVLVALGTVLAPKSTATVPLEYWAIVKYVKRMKKLNFNGFTRTFLINNIKKLGSGHEMVQWPCGNLALLQIDDDISAKHRREVINTPDIAPTSKRKQSKKAKATTSSMKTPGPVDDTRIELMFEQMMIKLTNHIDTTISKQMEKCADVSAQKLLKMLNAKGVVYRAGKADMSDDEDQEEEEKKEGVASTPSHGLPPKDFMDCDDIIKSDGIVSWLNSGKGQQDDESDDASKKTEPVDDSNFVTPTDKKKTTNGANAGYTTPVKHGDTPEVPIIIDDKATPASSCSPPIDLTLPDASEEFDSFNTMCRKAKESGKKEEKKEDAYFAVNIADCHWVTVVMHGDKKEFQVLDSLWLLKRSKGFVEMLELMWTVPVSMYGALGWR
ncbi:hypothetical protein ACQ4PT_054428 [Festuca glaucescens]